MPQNSLRVKVFAFHGAQHQHPSRRLANHHHLLQRCTKTRCWLSDDGLLRILVHRPIAACHSKHLILQQQIKCLDAHLHWPEKFVDRWAAADLKHRFPVRRRNDSEKAELPIHLQKQVLRLHRCCMTLSCAISLSVDIAEHGLHALCCVTCLPLHVCSQDLQVSVLQSRQPVWHLPC